MFACAPNAKNRLEKAITFGALRGYTAALRPAGIAMLEKASTCGLAQTGDALAE